MDQQNPFADLVPSQPQAPPQSYTIGRPDPIAMSREQRAAAAADRSARAEERAAAAAARAAENDARTAATSTYMPGPNGSLIPRPGGPADRTHPTAQATESQGKASAFLTRALGANRDYESLNVGPRSYAGQSLHGVAGDLQNVLPTALGGNDPTRQRADNTQSEFVAAVLRLDSGAAVPPAELEQYSRIYFPIAGDSPEVIAQKARARARVMQGLVAEAGQAARPEDLRELQRHYGGAPTSQSNGEGAAEGAARGSLAGAATGEGDPNFAQHIAGAPAGSPERFRMLEMYHNSLNNGQAQVRIGLGDNPGEGDFIDQFGVTEAQGRQLEEEYQRELPVETARRERERFDRESPFTSGVDTFLRSGMNAITLGGYDAVGADPRVEHAITNQAWNDHPVVSLGGTLAGGLALPLPASLGRQALAGGAYSGVYGFNSRDGSIGERLPGALGDAATGAGITGLIGLGMRAAGRGGGGPSNPELMQAAQRQGVDILPADVGGTMTQRLTGGTGQTIFGSGPVVRAARTANNQAGARVAEIAADAGAPVQQEVLGEVAQRGANRYINESGQVGRGLYQEASDLSHDVIAQAPTAFRNLNAQIRELGPTAAVEGDLVPALNRFRSVIADESGLRPLDVQSMRRLRTSIANEARSDALRTTDYGRRTTEVLNNLRDDIASHLSPDARQAFLRADSQWADRLNVIDDVMTHVLGPTGERSAEHVANRLSQMSRGDSARLGRFLSEIPPEEAGTIRASLIDGLGRAPAGQQGAAGDTFSLNTFLTKWNELPERARGLLFRGDSRAAIEDIATIAEGAKATSRFANTSSTAGASNVSEAIRHVSAFSAFGTLGATAIVENLTGRLLASPRFARWLARTPSDPGRAIRALQRVAVAEPSLRGNIDTLIQAVQRTGQDLAPAVSSAAADDRQDRR